jgi:hypothetical protein
MRRPVKGMNASVQPNQGRSQPLKLGRGIIILDGAKRLRITRYKHE